MSLKQNVVANFVGQGWTALMSIAFIPLYIKYLGVEAYGLIGIFALLQTWLNLLDLGLSPALSREMALFQNSKNNSQPLRELLRSIEILALAISLVVIFLIWIASDWLAKDWLTVKNIPIDSVAQSLVIMGIVAALRFIENIYRSSIVGLEKHVLLNNILIVISTLRGLGAVGVLAFLSPTVYAFFLWQGIVSILSVVLLGLCVYKQLPSTQTKSQFSLVAISKIWRYASGIMLITLLSFLLMQTDKILLSRLLSLEHFAYYSLAGLLASSLQIIAGPIDTAFFPRLTEQASQNDSLRLASIFHLGAQLISVLVGAAAIELIFFGDVILNLWTQNPLLSKTVAPLLVILSIGTLLNAFMHMPYQLQLAHGWTRLTVYVNAVAVLLLVPAIFFVAPRYGAEGAACIWVLLNLSYVLVSAQIMFKRMLTSEKLNWYKNDIAKPILGSIVIASLIKWLAPNVSSGLEQLALLIISSTAIFSIAAFSAPLVKKEIMAYIENLLKHNSVRKF